MNAGDMNKRLDILYYAGFIDPSGVEQEQWKLLFQCWGSVKNISGREFFKSGQEIGSLTTNFGIRYNPKIEGYGTDQLAIGYQGKRFNCKYINVDPKKINVEITGELVKNGS